MNKPETTPPTRFHHIRDGTHSHAPTDAYEVPGLHRAARDAIKAWCVQTLGAGRPLGQWAGKHAKTAKGYKVRQVGTAMLAQYPFLADLAALVPPADLAGLPDDEHGWAAGQWLVQREASIIGRAMADLSGAGVIVLPVHDSLVVPASAVSKAVAALEAAFVDLAGIVPRLEVTSP